MVNVENIAQDSNDIIHIDSYGEFLLGFLVFSAYKTRRHGESQEIKLSLARTDQSGETVNLNQKPFLNSGNI